MKTLTITEGRGRLGYWLKKATEGEDIGFMFEGKIVALRPVEVVSTDYALQEYGLTAKEMEAAEKRIHAELKTARRRGELTVFTGNRRPNSDSDLINFGRRSSYFFKVPGRPQRRRFGTSIVSSGRSSSSSEPPHRVA
jgi:hypothetical protein